MGQPHFETVASVADRVETHQIWRLEVTAEQIGFAAARQIFAIRRIVAPKSATAKASDEISHGITSLDFAGTIEQNAQALLTIRRRHWSIESKSHHSRDKTYQEDTCQVRDHQAARTLVAFRQLAIFLSLQHAHKPSNKRDCCLPEFNRFCVFNRDVVLRWFRKPTGIRASGRGSLPRQRNATGLFYLRDFYAADRFFPQLRVFPAARIPFG
jgi:predicted transposase YbfD/YdcC